MLILKEFYDFGVASLRRAFMPRAASLLVACKCRVHVSRVCHMPLRGHMAYLQLCPYSFSSLLRASRWLYEYMTSSCVSISLVGPLFSGGTFLEMGVICTISVLNSLWLNPPFFAGIP